ncbi:MAG: hypothetical protein D3906_15575 [Candidatus Electrothrix sp. AUS1_2]|nr:hypothetical protein [Candidatus Electrothrix sp. AUS1_2]
MYDEDEDEYNRIQAELYGDDYAEPDPDGMTEDEIEAYFGPDVEDEDEYNRIQAEIYGDDYAEPDPDNPVDLDEYFADL